MSILDTKEPIKKVAIYYRVSSDEQVEMYGIPVQEKKIFARLEYNKDRYELASIDGKPCIYNESVEKGVSGREDFKNRPVGQKILRDLEMQTILKGESPFELIVIYKLDRLARKVSVLYDAIREIEKHNVTVVSATESFDFTTPFGKAMAGILGVFAELERDNFMERSASGKEEMKLTGRLSMDTYGYQRDSQNFPVIDSEEAQVINTIFIKYAIEGLSLKQICNYLTDQNIEIPSYTTASKGSSNNDEIEKKQIKVLQKIKGKTIWSDQTVRTILKDEKYITIYRVGKTHKNSKTNKQVEIATEEQKIALLGTPRIVSDDLFYKAQARFKKGKSSNKIREDSGYLLSGLLYCDYCKQHRLKYEMCTWQGKPSSGQGKEIYQCYGKRSDRNNPNQRCTCLPLNREDLDKLVLFHVLHLLKNPKSLTTIYEKQVLLGDTRDRLSKHIAGKEQLLTKMKGQKEKIIDNYYKHNDENLTLARYNKYISEMDLEIDTLMGEIKTFTDKLNETIDTESYLNVLTIIHEKLLGENREQTKSFKGIRQLLLYVVKRIVIYSKETDSNKGMPGKRGSKLPAIPYKISIELKLPQDYINHFDGYDPEPFSGGPNSEPNSDDKIKNNIKVNNNKSVKSSSRISNSLIHTKNTYAPYHYIIQIIIHSFHLSFFVVTK